MPQPYVIASTPAHADASEDAPLFWTGCGWTACPTAALTFVSPCEARKGARQLVPELGYQTPKVQAKAEALAEGGGMGCHGGGHAGAEKG